MCYEIKVGLDIGEFAIRLPVTKSTGRFSSMEIGTASRVRGSTLRTSDRL